MIEQPGLVLNVSPVQEIELRRPKKVIDFTPFCLLNLKSLKVNLMNGSESL